MAHDISREKIGSDIYFTSVKDQKFKTSRISVNIIVSLDKSHASVNAIVPYILRRGGNDYPNFQKLNERLADLYGAALYADVRKIGDAQVLNFSIETLNDKFVLENEQVSNDSADLIISLLLNPKIKNEEFFEDDVNIEKKALIELIESEINDKRTYAVNRMESIMFEDEPYGLNRNGSVKNVEVITPNDAFKAYKRLLQTGRIEIICVGNSNSDMVKNRFRKAFAEKNREKTEQIQTIVIEKADKTKNVSEKMDLKQAKLVIGFRTGGGIEIDTDAMRVACAIYGGTPFSKLFMNVREKLSLCYYCSARYDRLKGYMLVSSGVELANKEKAYDEIMAQLKDVQEGNFSDDEISDTKLSLKNSFMSIYDSLSAIEAWYLSRIFTGDLMSPIAASKNIDSISRENIMAAMKRVTLDTIYLLSEGESSK